MSVLFHPLDCLQLWIFLLFYISTDINITDQYKISVYYQFSSVAQLCLTLCNSMDCSSPGFPVHHQLLEFAQTHACWVSDAIQPSPLSCPSPPAFFCDSALHSRWPKYWSFSFSISPSNEYSGLILFRIDWLIWQASIGFLKSCRYRYKYIIQILIEY